MSALLKCTDLRPGDLKEVWVSAFREVFPDAVLCPWGGRELGSVNILAKKWREESKLPFGEFLDWCVRHWKPVMAEQFHWMRAFPEHPAILFFVKFTDRFAASYSRKTEMSRKLGMTAKAKMISDLTSQNIPLEVAEEEVDSRLGLTEEREKINKARRELQKERFALEEVKKRAARKPAPLARKPSQPVAPTKVRPIDETAMTFSAPVNFGKYKSNHE